MPRRTVLSSSEREGLFALPDNQKDLIQQYTFSESDLSIIRQHRGAANHMGFAIQLCYMRYPDIILSINEKPFPPLLNVVADQLKMTTNVWDEYGKRDQTRREHLAELQTIFGFQTFSMESYQSFVNSLADLTWQTDKGIVLASALVQSFRSQRILLPSINVIERICAEAITNASRRIYFSLTEHLTKEHLQRLNALLALKEDSKFTTLAWLRESPGAAKARHIQEHIERLKAIRNLDLPVGLDKMIHQNRLLKLAREGRQMTAHDLSKFEPNRRYATIIALIIEAHATIIDEIIEMHDRIIGSLFARSQRNQEKLFQQSGKSINEKLRLYYRIGNALIEAKQKGSDPFVAIENVIPWDTFTQSLTDTQKLAPSEDFDYLEHIKNGYSQIRRYAPALLDNLQLKANPALRELLEAVEIIKAMNANQSRKIPKEAPTGFVRKRWKKFVFSDDGLDRCFYELCVLSELKNALRSGDIWVQGSRQFKDFEEYLLPTEKFALLKEAKESPIAVTNDCSQYLQDRLLLLEEQLKTVNRLAKTNELPDAIFTASGLKITPLTNSVPIEAEALTQQVYSLLPRVKITELLIEVDGWIGFTKHFRHIKNNETANDKHVLLTAILADAINLGLRKMTDSCPGTTYAKLSWLQQQWEVARQQAKHHQHCLLIIDEIQKIPHWSEIVKALWDQDTRNKTDLSVMILGSSPWLMQKGLSESLAGRFEVIPIVHWSYQEMHRVFGWSLDKYIYFGGYPGAAPLANEDDPSRWINYISESLIETSIARDILLMTQVNKPVLLRRLFQLGCCYSGQVLSYTKMLGDLQDSGNTTTLAHYLDLLSGAGLLSGLQKFAQQKIRQKGSSPKFCVFNTALMSSQASKSYHEAKKDRSFWGRLVESSVGAYLLNSARGTQVEVFYWREGDKEVDFVIKQGKALTAIEVKSGLGATRNSGLDLFVKQFSPSRILLVGEQGISLADFLTTPIKDFL